MYYHSFNPLLISLLLQLSSWVSYPRRFMLSFLEYLVCFLFLNVRPVVIHTLALLNFSIKADKLLFRGWAYIISTGAGFLNSLAWPASKQRCVCASSPSGSSSWFDSHLTLMHEYISYTCTCSLMQKYIFHIPAPIYASDGFPCRDHELHLLGAVIRCAAPPFS